MNREGKRGVERLGAAGQALLEEAQDRYGAADGDEDIQFLYGMAPGKYVVMSLAEALNVCGEHILRAEDDTRWVMLDKFRDAYIRAVGLTESSDTVKAERAQRALAAARHAGEVVLRSVGVGEYGAGTARE